MTDRQWELFFDLVDKIVNDHGTWQQKRQEALDQAKMNCEETNFEEFLGWFKEDA